LTHINVRYYAPDVRFGSKADMTTFISDVRFIPESGHWSAVLSPSRTFSDWLNAVFDAFGVQSA
jgi:hypothetical protein